MNQLYEAYVHSNGTIQVKRHFMQESSIDLSSPFVVKYLGTVQASSYEEAKAKFELAVKEYK